MIIIWFMPNNNHFCDNIVFIFRTLVAEIEHQPNEEKKKKVKNFVPIFLTFPIFTRNFSTKIKHHCAIIINFCLCAKQHFHSKYQIKQKHFPRRANNECAVRTNNESTRKFEFYRDWNSVWLTTHKDYWIWLNDEEAKTLSFFLFSFNFFMWIVLVAALLTKLKFKSHSIRSYLNVMLLKTSTLYFCWYLI